ncbi:MAG: GHKL domain-containing protein [Lachnospiraceae bacterium]|nr:GHKL domain-containing protein [Lachnospiraceae bacterium]
MVIGVAEALGVFLIDLIMEIMQIIPQSTEIQKSIETAFSKIVLLFLYYAVFSRLWKKSFLRTKTQYILYLIMFLYSVVNVLIIAVISDRENPLILMVIVGSTIFANMYLLSFIKFSDERNYYRMQLEMMEQQEKLQYDKYEIQREKYKEAMAILHDVDKHMKMIEGLYQENLKREALNYTEQIRKMLQPLVPFRYTDNPVLNCLLSDKKRVADSSGISFKIEIDDVDISYMKPIDITTLFGNLIDNALEANKKCTEKKYIGLYIKEYNEMLSIRIENSVDKFVVIKNGRIDSNNEKRNGIGLLNIQKCVEDYLGSIIYKYTNQLLVCDIVLNRVDE